MSRACELEEEAKEEDRLKEGREPPPTTAHVRVHVHLSVRYGPRAEIRKFSTASSVNTIIVYCIKRCNSPERFINEQMELGPGT